MTTVAEAGLVAIAEFQAEELEAARRRMRAMRLPTAEIAAVIRFATAMQAKQLEQLRQLIPVVMAGGPGRVQ